MKIAAFFYSMTGNNENLAKSVSKELSAEQKNNDELLSGCVAGALLKDDYLNKIKSAGFNVRILVENQEISKKQYQGIALESLTVELIK